MAVDYRMERVTPVFSGEHDVTVFVNDFSRARKDISLHEERPQETIVGTNVIGFYYGKTSLALVRLTSFWNLVDKVSATSEITFGWLGENSVTLETMKRARLHNASLNYGLLPEVKAGMVPALDIAVWRKEEA